MNKPDWISVYKYFNIIEGQELESLLKENAIPCLNIAHQDTTYPGLFKPEHGEGEIRVPKNYAAQAEQVVNDFKFHGEPIPEMTDECKQELHAAIERLTSGPSAQSQSRNWVRIVGLAVLLAWLVSLLTQF